MFYKKNAKKGFTLIELLAVIVILGILALIAVPMILNVIEKAKKGAFKDSIYGIMSSAELYVGTHDFNFPITFIYPEEESAHRMGFSGDKPTEGYLQVLKSGKISLKLGNGSYCASKREQEEEIAIEKGNCDIETLKAPIISGYGKINQEVSFHSEYVFPVVTATDYHGNIIDVKREIRFNDSIVEKIETSKLGAKYTIIYRALDEATGLSSTVEVMVTVVDKESPVIEVLGKTVNQTVSVEASTTEIYQIPTAKVTDNSGEEITAVVSGIVNLQIPDTYQLTYTATDSALNVSTLILTIIVKDTTIPTVTYTLSSDDPIGEEDWYKSDVTVILSGTDLGTGIKGYEYALMNNGVYGAYQPVTGNRFVISKEGAANQFKVKSKDGVGNSSTELESEAVKIDKKRPNSPGGSMSPSGWTAGPVSISLNGYDSLSGVSKYSFDEGLTWQTGNSKSFSTNQSVYVMVRDKAGNTSVSSLWVIDNIELTKPSVEFAVVGTPFNSDGWAMSNFNINIIPHVGVSGINSYKYCLTTDSICTPNIALSGASQAVTITTESATNKVCVELKDKANNTTGTVCSQTYKLDKTAPVIDSIEISDIINYNFSAYILATDQAGIKNVECAVSTSAGGYNDTYTYQGVWDAGKNSYRCDIKYSDFNQYGVYRVIATASDYVNQKATLQKGLIQNPKIEYTVDEAGSTITGYTGTATSLRIPSKINGITITGIGNSAFYNKKLTAVTLPDTITAIGDDAFFYNQLTTITLPSSIVTLGSAAFAANQISTVNFPTTLKEIPDNLFRQNALTKVTIPEGITAIGFQAFSNNKLSSLTLPSTLKMIDGRAFATNNLTYVTIPSSVTEIGDAAFYENVIRTLTLSEGLQVIGSNAFYMNQLTQIVIPKSVMVIKDLAFFGGVPSSPYITGVLTSVKIKGKTSTSQFTTFGANLWVWKDGYSNSNIIWNAS